MKIRCAVCSVQDATCEWHVMLVARHVSYRPLVMQHAQIWDVFDIILPRRIVLRGFLTVGRISLVDSARTSLQSFGWKLEHWNAHLAAPERTVWTEWTPKYTGFHRPGQQ